jgi:hypothetical protein
VTLWASIVLAVALFCIVRGIVDVRQRRYAWGAVGIIAGLALLLTPIETHAVRLDLPVGSER